MHPLKLSQSGTEGPLMPCQASSSASTASTKRGAATTAKYVRPTGLSPRVGAATSATAAAAAGTLRPHGTAPPAGGAAPIKSAASSCRTTPRKTPVVSGASPGGTTSSHGTPRPQRSSEVPPLAATWSSSSNVVSTGHTSKGHPNRFRPLSQAGTPNDAMLPVSRRSSQSDTPRGKKSPIAGRTTPRAGQSTAPTQPPSAVSHRLAPLKLRRPQTPPSSTTLRRVTAGSPRPCDGTSDGEESNEPFAEVSRQTPRAPTPRSNTNATTESFSAGVQTQSQPPLSLTPRTFSGHLQHVAATSPRAVPTLVTPASSPTAAAAATAAAPPPPRPPPLPLYRVAATASGGSGVSLASHRYSTPRISAPTAPRVPSSAHGAPALVESTASLSLTLELLPNVALQLPPCTDAHLQRLFEVLLLRSGGSVWDLHEHILPFIAARQHAIMSVTPAQLASFVRRVNEHAEGDDDEQPDAPWCDEADVSLTMPVEVRHYDTDGGSGAGPAAPPAPYTRFTAPALARFGSQLCSWFFLMGHLSTSDTARWETVLSPISSVPPTTTTATSSPTVSARQRASLEQPDRRASTSAPPNAVASAGPGTPEKRRRRRSRLSQRRSIAGTMDDGADSGTVEWRTDQLEQSARDASLGSTKNSLDFHVVVEAPPRVDADAFRRGFHVLQALLRDRAAQLAALKPGPERTALLAACTVTQTDTTTKPWELRAIARRVRFYLRLHAFLRELCVMLCAHEQQPWQRESELIESAISARLAASIPIAQGNTRHVKRALQAAVRAGPTDVSPNALDTLLVLSHGEAARVVHRAKEASRSVAAASAAVAPLPAALLLLFPPPRWGVRAWPATPSLLRVTAAWRLLGLLAAAMLCYGMLFWVPVGCGRVPAMVRPMRHAVCAARVGEWGDGPSLDPVLVLLGCGGLLVMWLGGIAAHRTGAALATQELCCATTRQHAAALASASRGWLATAWTAQGESDIAAQAVQHSLQCLQMVQDTVQSLAVAAAASTAAGSGSRGTGLAAVVLLLLTAAALMGVSVPPALLGRAGLLLLLWLQTCAVMAIRFVTARRHQHRALQWWVRYHAATAEKFAAELVSCFRCVSQGAAASGERELRSPAEREEPHNLGGTLSARSSPAPSPAALAALRGLCEVPLPVLEECSKVACLVSWCAQSSGVWCPRSPRTAPSFATRHGIPVSGPALAERVFWAALCGHVAPAYSSHTSATDVVERAMRGCWKRLEAAPAACASVTELIVRILPWTTDANEGCVDEQLTDVLAPLSSGNTRRSTGPGGSCSIEGDAAAPLEVEGRRQPYLSQAQRRLVVVMAFVFTVVRAAPRGLHAAPRRRSATRADSITPQSVALLEHLVHAELHAPHNVDAKSWRRTEAATRTQAALQLLQRHVVSAPFFEALATQPVLLPPLLETLFR